MSNFSFKEKNLQFWLYKFIINKNNPILYLNLLFYFECECDLFFKKLSKGKSLNNIKNEQLKEYSNFIIKNLSMKYFKKSMDYY